MLSIRNFSLKLFISFVLFAISGFIPVHSENNTPYSIVVSVSGSVFQAVKADGSVVSSSGDASAVLQAAIDSLPYMGGAIFIRVGEYPNINVVLKHRTWLVGEGFGSHLRGSVTANSVSNTGLKDLWIDARGLTRPALILSGTKYFAALDVKFQQDATSIPVITIDGGQDYAGIINIERAVVVGAYYGVHLATSSAGKPAHSVSLKDSILVYHGPLPTPDESTAIVLDSNGKGLNDHFSNLYLEGWSYGIQASDGYFTATGIWLDRCRNGINLLPRAVSVGHLSVDARQPGNAPIIATVNGKAYTGNEFSYDSNSNQANRNSGRAVFTGDGVRTGFRVAHGLPFTPQSIAITAGSSAATGKYYATADANDLIVTFSPAPANGSSVIFYWAAEK